MKLDISDARIDGTLETHWDALLRAVGTFEVEVGGRQWYREEQFCLVEFAAALVEWLGSLEQAPRDFVYTSLESAEPEILRFHLVGSEHWQLTARHEAYREERRFSTAEIRQAAAAFIATFRAHLPWRQRILSLLSEIDSHKRLVRALE